MSDYLEHSTVEAFAKTAAEWMKEYRETIRTLQDGPNDEASAKLEEQYPVADMLLNQIVEYGTLTLRINNQCIHVHVATAFCAFFETMDAYNALVSDSTRPTEEKLPLSNIYNQTMNVLADYIIDKAKTFHEYVSTRTLEDELNEM